MVLCQAGEEGGVLAGLNAQKSHSGVIDLCRSLPLLSGQDMPLAIDCHLPINFSWTV